MTRFSSLKSRLGFGSQDESGSVRRTRSDSYEYDDEYDSFDEYEDTPRAGWDTTQSRLRSARSSSFEDDYGDYNEEFAEYGPDYDENAPTDTYRPIVTSRAARSGGTYPSLVTMNDVKMSTPLPEIPPIDADTSETVTPIGRTIVENTGPAPYSPAHRAAASETNKRPDRLDSLFGSSSVSDSVSENTSPAVSGAGSLEAADISTARRNLRVVKPVAYADAEQVSRGLKAGDVVVLAMRNTPEILRGRILDFAFGAASALDANVECPAEKVFALARGKALDAAELQRLHDQGVL